LQRVDDTEDFIRVTSGTGGVVDDGSDNFLGIDEENCADSQSHTLRIDVGGILIIDHVVQERNLPGLIRNNRETQMAPRNVIDILNPFLMRLERIGTQPNELDATFRKLRFKFGEGTELKSITSKQR
jgi:hypothetical protein